jgi:hypothetical protein
MPEQRLDVALHPASVVSDRRWFLCRYPFGKVEIAEFLHLRSLPVGRARGSGIATSNYLTQKSQCFFARLLGCPGRPMASDRVPSLTSADPVFEEVVYRAAAPATRAEAWQLVIPNYSCRSRTAS